MISLINPNGLQTFFGLNTQIPKLLLSLAYIAERLREAGYEFSVIDAVEERLDLVEIVQRIDPSTTISGVTCTFSIFTIANHKVTVGYLQDDYTGR